MFRAEETKTDENPWNQTDWRVQGRAWIIGLCDPIFHILVAILRSCLQKAPMTIKEDKGNMGRSTTAIVLVLCSFQMVLEKLNPSLKRWQRIAGGFLCSH